MPLSKIDSDSLSAPLTVPAGSAAAPAITTTGDTNTGIFFPAADTIAFAEGGTESMRIDSSGNVGIGTSSSGYKLDVYDASAAFSTLRGDTDVLYIISRASTNASAASLQLRKSRGTQASPTVVASEDIVGRLQYFGYDGATMLGAAEIRATIDGTPGTNDMPGRLTFYTTSDGASTVTERARIDSSGQLLVGTTAFVSGQNGVLMRGTSGGYTDEVLQTRTAGTASTSATGFYNNNGRVGTISTSGSSTSYNTSSDYRLKNTIAPMTGALAKVALLKPVTYKWNVDGSDGQGFIAHELAEVEAGCVTGEKDAVDAEGNPQYQGIDTSFLVATLTAAIQELKAIVDAQGAEIAALKGTP